MSNDFGRRLTGGTDMTEVVLIIVALAVVLIALGCVCILLGHTMARPSPESGRRYR